MTRRLTAQAAVAAAAEPAPSHREVRLCAQAEAVARLAAKRKASGLCVRCGDPAAPGKTSCAAHVLFDRERSRRMREEHKAAGLCVCCSDPVAPGHAHCPLHLEKERQRAATRPDRDHGANSSPGKTARRRALRAGRRGAALCVDYGTPGLEGAARCKLHPEARRQGASTPALATVSAPPAPPPAPSAVRRIVAPAPALTAVLTPATPPLAARAPLPRALPVLPVEQIAAGRDLFFCEPFRAKLAASACLGRQEMADPAVRKTLSAQERFAAGASEVYARCRACPTGIAVAARVAAGSAA